MKKLLTSSFVVLVIGSQLGCSSTSTIEGQRVAKLRSDAGAPSCPAICKRLRQICGYAPVDCTAADAGGYCELNFDEQHRSCVGMASDCQEAWSCTNAEAEPSDAAAEEETSDGAVEASADAKPDAPADGKADADASGD